MKLVDTPADIKNVLLSTNSDVINARKSFITGIASTNSPAAIELTLEQFVEATGETYTGPDNINLPVTNLFGNLGNIELVVSGTAEELNGLFAKFGNEFEELGVGVSFRVTDGGEVTLNAAQLDVLDGRLTGTAIVVDDSDGMASMLEKAIPTSVKDIAVDDNNPETTEDKLILSVAQFRNLPAYASDEVVVRDSAIQINRALSYGTLDDRVTEVHLTDASIDDGLTLNVATAEKLGNRKIFVDGESGLLSAPLVIRDRASTIANYIETGSLPDMGPQGSVMFVESNGNNIDLNGEQWSAYQDLSEYIRCLPGATFQEASIEGYIDERLADLSKALDSTDPLAQYDQYQQELGVE